MAVALGQPHLQVCHRAQRRVEVTLQLILGALHLSHNPFQLDVLLGH